MRRTLAVLYPALGIVVLGVMAFAVLILSPLFPYAALVLISAVLAGPTGLWGVGRIDVAASRVRPRRSLACTMISVEEALRLLGIKKSELLQRPTNVYLLQMILDRADTAEKVQQLREDLIEAGKRIRGREGHIGPSR